MAGNDSLFVLVTCPDKALAVSYLRFYMCLVYGILCQKLESKE